MSNVNLVGFIHQYRNDDFSIWNVQLSAEDEKVINTILEKYQTQGFSVRGNSELTIKEAF